MKAKYIDLHSHTNYSDGFGLSPEYLVQLQALKGLDIIAKTDHDTLKGIEAAVRAGNEWGVQVIPGVEITTMKYHLLALNPNINDEEFRKFIQYSGDLQNERCRQRVELLRNTGVPISMEKIKTYFPESRLGKGNMLITLFQDKECRDYLRRTHPEFTRTEIRNYYLGETGIASGIELGVDEKAAIDAVHRAGGIIGIAHPPKDVKDIAELDLLLSQGMDFLEIQPNMKPKYEYDKFEEWARQNNVPVSYGSDYHGPAFPRPLLGRGENVLSEGMRELLNRGYVKIPEVEDSEAEEELCGGRR